MDLGSGRYGREVLAQSAAFAVLVDGADPTVTVPTCPEWTLGELVGHVGQAVRWAAAVTAKREFVPPALVPDAAVPADPLPWLRSAGAVLVAAVEEIGAEQDTWTWSADRRAVFWLRRMTHELVVHRADAAAAVGAAFEVEPDLAADAVTEFLGLLPDRVRLDPAAPVARLAGPGERLHLQATDGSGEWLLTRTAEGLVTTHERPAGAAEVTVRGPAADLALVLYRRRSTAEAGLAVSGDAALFEFVCETAKF
ncbi:maleylpyruvate isomerase family mycothiol-dependent enzyme [Amycolatopsis rhabdoformis]|uniref:Maleylpyruvate isomerase family mycothiol-dependent enzyme n=1 Tax=Amycolatopsis rhabdoformis TaxID=1448059 RepID=A0ABZ1IBL6_9PSEU|nr:maleylpyruvate isomerase family mycothiol-dependent enzyme [Amycolatopsis rhabdoformis]WSE31513.1 maleylpyruvate isomerase family mycothiol-dependent enzyme [Amycolatopsis rhabdoformis]